MGKICTFWPVAVLTFHGERFCIFDKFVKGETALRRF